MACLLIRFGPFKAFGRLQARPSPPFISGGQTASLQKIVSACLYFCNKKETAASFSFRML